MKKTFIFLCLAVLAFSCGIRPTRQPIEIFLSSLPTEIILPIDTATIEPAEEIILPVEICNLDSLILADSIRRIDSLKQIEFKNDSINFRQITRKVNGGYNGFDERFDIFTRALEVFSEEMEWFDF